MNNRKIIFLDIDGTLTEPGKNIPPESALRAIRQAREAGHLVYLCSGRNYDMLSPLLRYPFDGVVASSGGYILCGEELIYDCPMTPTQQALVLEVLEQNGIFYTVECLHGTYTDERFKEFLKKHAAQDNNSEVLRWREEVETALHILPMSEYRGEPIYKILLLARKMEQVEEARHVLDKEFFFSIPQGGWMGFVDAELVNRKFDKGKAVQRVCRYLHIPVEDSIGFGDSVNDREMMKAAGLSICMANGSDEVKALADEVCPAVTEDGLYKAFAAHGLC